MVIISLSGFHQKVRFDCVFPIEIPLFHEKALFHFNLSRAYFEGFFESCAPDVVPAGAFWELEIWLFDFFKPFVRLPCPQGPFGGWKFDFFNFSSPLSGCRARRGLLGTGNLTFSIFQARCPVVVPAGAFWELEFSPVSEIIDLAILYLAAAYFLPTCEKNNAEYKKMTVSWICHFGFDFQPQFRPSLGWAIRFLVLVLMCA